MSNSLRYLWLALCACAALTFAQTITPSVGSGVSPYLQYRFQLAFLRGNFSKLVSQPPVADVHAFGTTGLIQEFYDPVKTAGVKAALILPDQTKVGADTDVLQVLPDVYVYYNAVGVNTAGYPIEDTQSCATFLLRCSFQRFTNSYALFAEPVGNANGTQFSISGNLYLKWATLNNVAGPLGIPATLAKTTTSPLKTTANFQTFAGGNLFEITSGTNKGLVFSTLGATDALYQSLGGPTGPLGLPTTDELSLAGGIQRQLFEGGRIQYLQGGTPALFFPVNEVQLSVKGPLTLQSGQTVTVNALAYDTFGSDASGRAITWSTTNGQVVSIQANGAMAALKALGSGYALITATSEGKVSPALLVNVSAPCCGVGEGAPSVAIGQIFQDAVTRNKLAIQIPGPNPVKRVSTGYTQDLLSTDGVTHYLLAKSDRSGSAYLVSGALLAAYLQAGGPTGGLGFPAADISPGGVQLFEGGALAGSPYRVVFGAVLAKWAALKYEAGAAGLPTAAAASFSTPSGFSGQSQQFAGGVIYGLSNGSRASQGFFVSGPILSRYLALNGPAGPLGLPITDAFVTGTVQRQNFENGYIDFTSGAAAAIEHFVPRSPLISANPTSALAGSRLHLSISGFPDGSTLRVSVAGQPDFTVKTPNGAYDYDLYIDASVRSSTVAVHAVDLATGKTADGAYTIRTIADARPALAKVAGDNQTGTPGSLLPVRLAVALKDSSGAPLVGVSVAFAASPGAQASPSTALTDSNGVASVALRLPPVSGVAAVTANSLGQLAIFNARASGSAPGPTFPSFSQTSGTGTLGNGPDTIAEKGGLLTAIAAVVRFYQNQGLLATPNGLADPNSLNRFLTSYCAPVCDGFVSSNSAQQVVNPWRVAAFVGGGLVPSVEDPSLTAIRDLVGAGSPVLLTLDLQRDGAPVGGATVVATGVGPAGDLQTFDPNPALGRTSLNDYLAGFSAAGFTWRGTLLSALRLLPGQPTSTGFVFASSAATLDSLPALDVQSAAGSCGRTFVSGNSFSVSAANSGISEFLYCDGTQPLYQASLSAPTSITDLAPGGLLQTLPVPTSVQITRAPAFTVSTPSVNFMADSVVNAASFRPAVSPGEIVSVFGSGLSGPGAPTSLSIGGLSAPILAATSFQVNAQIPLDLAPGQYTLSVRSAFGVAEQPLTVVPVDPAIFILEIGEDGAALGAIVNQSGAVNRPNATARRGETLVVYGTGFGAVVAKGNLATTVTPVVAVLGGVELPVAYAGLAPGFLGLYQINVPVPLGTPPGLGLPFSLRQGNSESNSVRLALQ